MEVGNIDLWNSLEITKFFVSVLSPITIVAVGYYVNRNLKRFEHQQWRNQKLIEKRLSVYDQIAPLLNDLYCYYMYIGQWKEFTPVDIINKKRELDKLVYINAPLFSKSFFIEIDSFISLCFKTHNGWGKNAKLVTKADQRKRCFGDEWKNCWDDLFVASSDDIPKKEIIKEQYFKIMDVLSKNIGLNK